MSHLATHNLKFVDHKLDDNVGLLVALQVGLVFVCKNVIARFDSGACPCRMCLIPFQGMACWKQVTVVVIG